MKTRCIWYVPVLCLLVLRAESSVIFVNADNASGLHTGSSWSTAFTDLQSALEVAVSQDEIWVAPGTYKPSAENAGEICFLIKTNTTLLGGFSGTETEKAARDWKRNQVVLTGDLLGDDAGFSNMEENANNVVCIVDNAVIDGFILTGGNADKGPYNCIHGGGMHILGQGAVVVRNCIFERNKSIVGGGLFIGGCDAIVENCVFSGNFAESANGGGGISVNWQCCPQIFNCLFLENYSGAFGGAVQLSFGGDAVISNCTFFNNSAYDEGGAISISDDSSIPEITNCLFSSNTAPTGNTIWKDHNLCFPEITYSFFDADTGSLCTDTTNLFYSDSCFMDPDDPDGVDDIYFTDDDGLQLRYSSPCVDGGDGRAAPATDITGRLRYDHPAVDNKGTTPDDFTDIGAYECYDTSSNVVLSSKGNITVTLTKASAVLVSDVYLKLPNEILLIKNNLLNVGSVVDTVYEGGTELVFSIQVHGDHGIYEHYSNSKYAQVDRICDTLWIVRFEDLPDSSADWDYNDVIIEVALDTGVTIPTTSLEIKSIGEPADKRWMCFDVAKDEIYLDRSVREWYLHAINGRIVCHGYAGWQEAGTNFSCRGIGAGVYLVRGITSAGVEQIGKVVISR